MGLLRNIFNDVVEIVSTPVKLVAKVTDDVTGSEIQDWVEETKEAVKVKE
jgi:hypothetical protein